MPNLFEQLIFTVGEIGWLADGAISFKTKCRATKALAMRVFEYLHDFKAYQVGNADILKAPLAQVEAVLHKAKEMTLKASRMGWLDELCKTQQIEKEFHSLEMEFEMVQIGMHSPIHQQICSRKINVIIILMSN